MDNVHEYTVSEISSALKRTVEEAFSYVRVRGEISGFKRAASGHLYFDVKDEEAVLRTVCWRGVAAGLSFAPEDGLEVVATGRISTYAGRSYYQLVVERMEPAGVGALMALLEKRKKQLAEEGLFAAERKQALPFLPKVIGVVTSPTGAVIRDILHRVGDRFPAHVLVWPVLVQGEGAAEQITAAIEGFNQLPEGLPTPDVLIVARGGGSLEDLWAFNEENVVRAAAASRIPLISAVGHETDTTLIDYVSDQRAPTPTAAAEMAVPVRAELLGFVMDLERRLYAGVQRFFQHSAERIQARARGLISPRQLLENMTQRLDDWSERLASVVERAMVERGTQLERLTGQGRLGAPLLRYIERDQQRVAALAQLLQSYHYDNVLQRGFALVRNAEEQLVTSATALKPGTDISLTFHDGVQPAVVAGEGAATPAPRKRARGKKAGGDSSQGSLF